MKTVVMLSVVFLLVLETSSTAAEDEAEERSSDQSGDMMERRSSEVQTNGEKKLFQAIPKIPASFLSHSFIYKCRK